MGRIAGSMAQCVAGSNKWPFGCIGEGMAFTGLVLSLKYWGGKLAGRRRRAKITSTKRCNEFEIKCWQLTVSSHQILRQRNQRALVIQQTALSVLTGSLQITEGSAQGSFVGGKGDLRIGIWVVEKSFVSCFQKNFLSTDCKTKL